MKILITLLILVLNLLHVINPAFAAEEGPIPAPVKDYPCGIVSKTQYGDMRLLYWYPTSDTTDNMGAILTYEVEGNTLKFGVVRVHEDKFRGQGVASHLYKNMDIPPNVDFIKSEWAETNLFQFRQALARYEERYPGDLNNPMRAACSPEVPSAQLWKKVRTAQAPLGFSPSFVDYGPREGRFITPDVYFRPIGPHTELPGQYYVRGRWQNSVLDTGLSLNEALSQSACNSSVANRGRHTVGGKLRLRGRLTTSAGVTALPAFGVSLIAEGAIEDDLRDGVADAPITKLLITGGEVYEAIPEPAKYVIETPDRVENACARSYQNFASKEYRELSALKDRNPNMMVMSAPIPWYQKPFWHWPGNALDSIKAWSYNR